ncbi:hypothetical protein [Chryseobacterium sp. CT-SW4]|uniref:hypothetical protein n=1 Tax=Chryseobacterium sp. SW-1 TaxID=3157343 RepID=UPI003B020564
MKRFTSFIDNIRPVILCLFLYSSLFSQVFLKQESLFLTHETNIYDPEDTSLHINQTLIQKSSPDSIQELSLELPEIFIVRGTLITDEEKILYAKLVSIDNTTIKGKNKLKQYHKKTKKEAVKPTGNHVVLYHLYFKDKQHHNVEYKLCMKRYLIITSNPTQDTLTLFPHLKTSLPSFIILKINTHDIHLAYAAVSHQSNRIRPPPATASL